MIQVEGFHVVPLGPYGCPAPDLASPPVKAQTGDIYLTQSSDRTAYTEWIRAGYEWVQVGETIADYSEVEEDELRKKRVANVRRYFKEQDLKRQRRNELISCLDRGEHLSREELRELSAMGYTI